MSLYFVQGSALFVFFLSVYSFVQWEFPSWFDVRFALLLSSLIMFVFYLAGIEGFK